MIYIAFIKYMLFFGSCIDRVKGKDGVSFSICPYLGSYP